MYYHGKFRNIDTSIDPRGQEYKVVIFTGYNGSESPYTFIEATGEPNLGIELTMTTSPFIVSYQNEDNNIFKPYKCSTATVSFIMNSFNSDLFSGNNDILVALLKRNNDIVLQGDSYINKLTNEVVIRKRAYGLFYGFLPSEEDTYCYTLEWIGFATPNTYNQNYTLLNQPFQLECQDAFSTLKYLSLPINEYIEIRDVKELVNSFIGRLGCYKNIYYPNNLYLPDTTESSIGAKIVQQYRNWIEKDSEPITELEIIEGIGEFLNVSFIPFRDSIYIVNYNGVANDDNYYYHYSIIPNNNLFFNFSDDNFIGWYNPATLESIEKNITLGKESFAGSDTNISMQTIYSNFAVKCNELEYDLMPDLSDQRNFSDSTRNNSNPNNYLYTETVQYSAPLSTRNWDESVYWNGGVISNFQPVNNIGFTSYIYNNPTLDGTNIGISNTIVHPYLTPNIFQYNTGCVSLKNTSFKGCEASENMFNSTRDKIWYNTNYPNDIVFFGKTQFGYEVSRDTYNTWWYDRNRNPVLNYSSPTFIWEKNKYLQIKGDWTFFRNCGLTSLPINDNQRNGLSTDNLNMTVDVDRLYITACISIYLSDGINQYTYYVRKNPNTDELFLEEFIYQSWYVDLPLNDENYDSTKPFGQVFSFKNSLGNNSGLLIDLGDLDSTLTGDCYIASISVSIMQPLGCAKTSQGILNANYPFFCESAVVKNLYFGLCDKDFQSSWGYGEIETDFHTKENKYLESFEVENKLSSNQYINKMAYNYSFRVFNHNYYYLDCLNNTSTSIIGRPEILKLADIYNQYKDKTIALNTTVWNNLDIQPNTRIKWGQFRNINFIVDRQEIDYEYNRNTLTLVEKKLSSEIPELDIKMWLENENGQTLNLNPFYNETFTPLTVSSYSADGSMITGGNEDNVNALIQFYPKWTDGVEAWVSVPNVLDDDIEVEINNNGELIITN